MEPATFKVKIGDGVLENLLGETRTWVSSGTRLLLHYDRRDDVLDPLLRKLLTKASKAAGEQLIPLRCVVSRYDNEHASCPVHSFKLFSQLVLVLGDRRPMLLGSSAIVLRNGTAVHIQPGVAQGLPEQYTKCSPQLHINLYVATQAEVRSPPLSAILGSSRQRLVPSSEFFTFRWARPAPLDDAFRPMDDVLFDLWQASQEKLAADVPPANKRMKTDIGESTCKTARVPTALPSEWGVDAKVSMDFAGLSKGAREICLRRLQKIFDDPTQVRDINNYCSSLIKGVSDSFGAELQSKVRDSLKAKLAGSGWTIDDLDSSAVAALSGLPQRDALYIVSSLRPATISNLSAFIAGAAKKQISTGPISQALRSGWESVAEAFAGTTGEVSSHILTQVIKMACEQKKPEAFQIACSALSRFPPGAKIPLSTYNQIFKAAGHVGRWPTALELFGQLPDHLQPNRYTYTALFDAVVRGGGPQTMLWALWNDMQRSGVDADEKLMSSMLQGCSDTAVVDELLDELQWKGNTPSLELLTNMVGCYRRAGASTNKTWEILRLARGSGLVLDCQFFVQVVTALGFANDTGSVVLLMESLRDVYKAQPDVFLYTAAISACARAGDVGGAETILAQMRRDGVEPNEHTHCATIAVYSKSNQLAKAVKYFNSISNDSALPVEGYCSILSGCREVVDKECALHILKKAREHGPIKSACYTLARQTCTIAGDDAGTKQVDDWQRQDGVTTHVPTSTVDDPATGERLTFQPGNDDKEVAKCVNCMMTSLKSAGYDPQLWQYDPQISSEERTDRLKYHTEKKALAWALQHFPKDSCITVRKTIRCCVDCHNAFKVASRAYCRPLRILDQVRIHEFSAGKCSCGDWW